MIDWMARAKTQFLQTAQASTDKTDETPLSSVSSVAPRGIPAEQAGLSSVSSVATRANSAELAGVSSVSSAPLTGTVTHSIDRSAEPIPIVNAETRSMSPVVTRGSGNPYMSPEQGDDCHACGWDDAEIDAFLDRSARFAQMGRRDAEHLAERLTLRDRQADDRQMCIECSELEPSGRCAAARRGVMPGADRRLEPVQHILLRCRGFVPAASAHPFKQGHGHANHDN